jgi:HD-GYP domain-containing protein (c-di-GMP phosphodiesterase class II)
LPRPDRLKGDQIPITARIISVADVFDALSTDRPYRKAMPLEQCLHILHDQAEQGQLDGLVVQTLIQIVRVQTDAARAVA